MVSMFPTVATFQILKIYFYDCMKHFPSVFKFFEFVTINIFPNINSAKQMDKNKNYIHSFGSYNLLFAVLS